MAMENAVEFRYKLTNRAGINVIEKPHTCLESALADSKFYVPCWIEEWILRDGTWYKVRDVKHRDNNGVLVEA